MNILILAPNLVELPHITRYSNKVESYLNEFADEGEKADLLTFGDVSNNEQCEFDRYQFDDYQKAADIINKQYDACILQHHPEAYGGRSGDYILALADMLQVPLLTVFHKVSSEPKDRNKNIINRLANRSDKVMVFSRLSIEFLEHFYKVNRDKISLTDYGVPVIDSFSEANVKQLVGVHYKKVILACGPMCSASGFETIVNALSALQKNYPHTGLIIVNTGSDNRSSTEYKKVLQRLAIQRGVSELILLLDYEIVKDVLEQLMYAADVYIASGLEDRVLEDAFLSTAVSSGAAVLSTPSWYAKELLDDQKGSFFAFRSIGELTTEITHMFRSQNEVKIYRENAALYGVQNSWIVVVKKLKEVIGAISVGHKKNSKKVTYTPALLPDLNFSQLFSLNNTIGFVNESTYGIPDYSSGYSLLSNAMAMQVLAKANVLKHDEETIQAIRQCIGFIKLFRGEKNNWSTSLNYRLQQNKDVSEYELGYTVWALSTVYSLIDDRGIKDVVYGLILQLMAEISFKNNKAKAAALIGVVELLKIDQSNQDLIELMKRWTKQISELFPSDVYQSWQWHEEEVGEYVGLVPLALLNAYELLHDENLLSIAKRTMRFVERYVIADSRYMPKISGRKKGSEEGGDSSISYSTETYLITEAYSKLYEITQIDKYIHIANAVHNWYLGDNSIGRSLYDVASGGCYFSFSGRSVNPLMTTSSTAAYWLSHFSVYNLYFNNLLSENK